VDSDSTAATTARTRNERRRQRGVRIMAIKKIHNRPAESRV
jgi:hypothetical protein